MKRFFLFLSLALVLFGADFFSKAYIHAHVPHLMHTGYPYGGIPVFHNWMGIDFSINHVMNSGAAWGLFYSFKHALLYVRIFLIAGMLCYLFFSAHPQRQLPLVLIITGAVGNVVDLFIYGHVVDFFYFVFWGYPYPLFNVADSAIFCGIVILLIQSFLEKHRARNAH